MFSPKRISPESTAASLAALLILTSCGGGVPGEPAKPDRFIEIGPTDIAALAPGERLTVDTTQLDSPIEFINARNMDFSRVDLICPSSAIMPMNLWLKDKD